MKKLMTVVSLLFIYSFVFSQDLVVKSGSKGMYLEHKVAAKEGLFPLGRMYNVHPRHIASFNAIDFNKGLAIGQKINIPLTDTNFKQNVNKGVPVYYVSEKESLSNISVKSKAQIGDLRGWNNLAVDNVAAGTKLIVGFLITNEMQDKAVTITPKTIVVEESVSNVKKQEASEKKQPVNEVKKDVVVEESVSNVKKQESSEKKQPLPQVKKDTPVEESVSDIKKAEEQSKKIYPDGMKTEPVIVKQQEMTNNDGTGYFKNNFFQQVKTAPVTKDQTVTSSIFKTQSGWQDAKYYLLINGVEPGTIVKITNPSNSKTVYAKVLYSMDKIRQNQGVDMRISDAAASSLAVSETDKFILKVNY
ncbi:MAG TPA: LysM peptidoglycan-binding domain-containing protein [Chitinophagaceae bacterium]|nr:LysM peptidoglycan-binding domain-containing protein [Chitinophagaceae bacterium]